MSVEGTGKARILVVDDSKLMRKAAHKMLGDEFDVITADDGVDAWDQLGRDGGIQVVFTDLNMPRMDGFGFIEGMRADPAFSAVPVLVLTTESDAAKKQRAREAGATGWIVKPFDPVRLVDAVRRVAA